MDETEPVAVEETEERYDLRDPRAQRVFDERRIMETIAEVRGQLASAKVSRRLAQHGLLGPDQDLHPAKFDKAIAMHHQTLELLVQAHASMDEYGLADKTLDVAPSPVRELR